MGLRERWDAGSETLGGWLSVPSVVSAEITARSGFDYVCIDAQHGITDYQDAVGMIQAIELAGSTPVVRVPWNEPGIIGKMLDAGAHAVIVPMVNTADEAAAAVRAGSYPPDGARSWGPVFPTARHANTRQWAQTNTFVIPMVETIDALANLDGILSTPGVRAIYVGPADLSLSLGLEPRNNDGVAAFDEALAQIVAACQRHGVVPGVHATGPLTPRRREQGFQMITVTADLVAMRLGLNAELAAARGESASADDSSY